MLIGQRKREIKMTRTANILAIATGVAMIAGGEASPQSPRGETAERPSLERVAPKILTRPRIIQQPPAIVREGVTIAAFEMGWEGAPRQDVLRRIAAAAGVMLGKEVDQQAVMKSLSQAVSRAQSASWSRLEVAPQLMIRYDAAHDEVRLINEELDVATDLGGDIGEDAARELAEKFLDQLTSAGVLDKRLYAQAVLQLGYKRIGSGTRDGRARLDRIAEYRFTFRPRLEGVEMANAGVRMGILASGELSSIRFGGVTPKGEWVGDRLRPSGKGGYREAKIDANAIMSRLYAMVAREASVDVAWSRLMYVVRDDSKEDVVEPMFVVSLTERRLVNGEWVSSRRKTLAFSVTDPRAPPIDLDPPAARHETTQPTRRQ
jgi:hypothetical protein